METSSIVDQALVSVAATKAARPDVLRALEQRADALAAKGVVSAHRVGARLFEDKKAACAVVSELQNSPIFDRVFHRMMDEKVFSHFLHHGYGIGIGDGVVSSSYDQQTKVLTVRFQLTSSEPISAEDSREPECLGEVGQERNSFTNHLGASVESYLKRSLKPKAVWAEPKQVEGEFDELVFAYDVRMDFKLNERRLAKAAMEVLSQKDPQMVAKAIADGIKSGRPD